MAVRYTLEEKYVESFIRQVYYPGVEVNCNDDMQKIVDHCSLCQECGSAPPEDGNPYFCVDVAGVCTAAGELSSMHMGRQFNELDRTRNPRHRRYGVCDQ